MKLINDTLYADEGKVIDFAEPKFAVNDENVVERVHLYADYIKIAKFDKVENYIEVDKSGYDQAIITTKESEVE